MAAVKARLVRLERQLGSSAEDRAAGLSLLQMVSACAVNAQPGLELVGPQDTDERTYAEIEILRLTAQGRHAESDSWRARHPLREAPPPADSPGGMCRFQSIVDESTGVLEREQRAIAAARARLARAARNQARGRTQ
jgi:hypothetical protein